uniref:Uncharacterized protein n=1 Tax=Timema genevievae TaxID=629358 RepID=A0A7R9JRM8_TIMGE|nr:unnamed protein product [Timema genevievae]
MNEHALQNPPRWLHGLRRYSRNRLDCQRPRGRDLIPKIINASWKPESSARIAKHDDNVKNNWKLLTAGKLEVSPELKVHIEKFASRHNFVLSQPETPGLLITHTSQEAEKVSEFGNIIQSYKILKTEKSANLIGANSVSPVLVGEQMERSPFKELDTRKKIGPPVTLDKYREENPGCIPQQLEAKDAMGKLFADDELHIETKPMTKFKTKNVQKYVQKSSKVQEIKSSEYPEKIKIPKGQSKDTPSLRCKARIQNFLSREDGGLILKIFSNYDDDLKTKQWDEGSDVSDLHGEKNFWGVQPHERSLPHLRIRACLEVTETPPVLLPILYMFEEDFTRADTENQVIEETNEEDCVNDDVKASNDSIDKAIIEDDIYMDLCLLDGQVLDVSSEKCYK